MRLPDMDLDRDEPTNGGIIRPAWYPVREVIHSATQDWAEAQCVAAERAMAKALIAEIETCIVARGLVPEGGKGQMIVIPADEWTRIRMEAGG